MVQSGGVQERLADLRVHLREHSSRNWGPMGKGDLSFLYFSFFCHLDDLSFKRSLTWRTGFATATNARSRTQASLSTSLSPKFTVRKKQGKWDFNIFLTPQKSSGTRVIMPRPIYFQVLLRERKGSLQLHGGKKTTVPSNYQSLSWHSDQTINSNTKLSSIPDRPRHVKPASTCAKTSWIASAFIQGSLLWCGYDIFR